MLSLYHSAHRQTTTHHSPRPVQSDIRSGQCGVVEVPSIRRPHPLHQLAEGWGQSAGKGPSNVPAGAGQPPNQKHQGKGSRLSNKTHQSLVLPYNKVCSFLFFASCLCHHSIFSSLFLSLDLRCGHSRDVPIKFFCPQYESFNIQYLQVPIRQLDNTAQSAYFKYITVIKNQSNVWQLNSSAMY